MKSQEKLTRSYEAQKSLFEAAKQRKENKILDQISLIDAKIQKLQEVRESLTNALAENRSRCFRTIEDFLKQAEDQANS